MKYLRDLFNSYLLSLLFCDQFPMIPISAAFSSSTPLFLFFHSGHSLQLCPLSPHLKHSTTIVSCLLIILSSTPHYITLLFNTLNLFWETMVPFFFSFLLLQLQARCLNPLQFLHNFSFLPSSSSLSLMREHFSLSRLLINELYWVRDIMLTSLGME